VVLVPVPFDSTTCYKAGARDGPYHILAASPHMEFYDEETRTETYRCGIHTTSPLEPELPPENMVKKVRSEVSSIAKREQIAVVLGGDHSVSIGAIEAFYREKGPLNIIQFDAHTDLRESYQGSPFSHACVMRRVLDMGNVIQVGIRSLSLEEAELLESSHREPVWAKDVLQDREKAITKVLSSLEDLPTYVTIDLDCLDPSIMPAVGTPEPGGLLWQDIISFLYKITRKTAIIGFDVVELSPIPGLHAPDYLAARLVYKFLSYIYVHQINAK